MAEKRKDNKGRNLRDGEDQRTDGRYRYRYFDKKGQRHDVYSWRLVESDKPPAGKRNGKSLRELEKEIAADQMDGINRTAAEKFTINELFDKYIASRKNDLKLRTLNGYNQVYDLYIRDDFGKRKINTVKYSDVKAFYASLFDRGLKPNTLANVHKQLSPVFKIAVRDGYIRTNPTAEVLQEVKKGHEGDKNERRALTEREQELFIDFLNTSPIYGRYLPLFTVLLGTGCRVGEVIGLRWVDCDMKNRQISINHNTLYERLPDGKMGFYVTTPKTKAGCRIIPMLDEVHDALMQERKRQMQGERSKAVIDGYEDFVFFTATGNLICPTNINHIIRKICGHINRQEQQRAAETGRDPEHIEQFSVHNLRHTFCARLCENETNVKVIQEIMGHGDIGTTMNVYAEVTERKKQVAMYNLQGKIKIS